MFCNKDKIKCFLARKKKKIDLKFYITVIIFYYIGIKRTGAVFPKNFKIESSSTLADLREK